MRWHIAICICIYSLVTAGCTTTGRARAAVAREREITHFHPIQAIQPIIAFEDAVERQFHSGGMEPDQFAAVKRWTGASLSTLRGPHPEDWEAIARVDWPRVRSIVGPFDLLTPFANLIDKLIE